MTRLGRATLYMGGMAGMLLCLLVTGGLGFKDSVGTSWAIGSLLIVQTLINMTTIGPVSRFEPFLWPRNDIVDR
jgi:SP family general alpha glucoside:H+ symporter-like MFS transporter